MVACQRPVLLVEGEADQEAVPLLIRAAGDCLGLVGFSPAAKPVKAGEIRKLAREGELERFLIYAGSRMDGDSVLLILDCDDDCPVEIARNFSGRAEKVLPRISKKIGISFLRREFEMLYLICAPALAAAYPDYGWELGAYAKPKPCEDIRNAKGALRALTKTRPYKETRDQPKFVSALDFRELTLHSRSYVHLTRLLKWFAADCEATVYPTV